MIELSPIVACICEGGAETAIIDMLVDNELLKFSREQMLNEDNVVTAPEIEMLIILAEGKYKEYMKKSSSVSPSTFCKQDLKMKGNIKSQEFVREYFSDINLLINSIHEYKRVKNLKRGEIYLADLLK